MLPRLRRRSKVAETVEHEDADTGMPCTKKKSKRRSLKLSTAERSAVPAIIEPYRYKAQNEREWQNAATPAVQPCLQIHMMSHSEAKLHTYYHFECSLSMSRDEAPYLKWSGKRRLQHLRKGLHDLSKREMGVSYKKHFKDAPFAHRGGVRGTTKRLNAWCSRLADGVNLLVVPPLVVAQTLKLLGAPVIPGLSSCDKDGAARYDSFESASTTDAEFTEGAESDCSSYESDFESESESDASDSDMEEDLQHSEGTPIKDFELALAGEDILL